MTTNNDNKEEDVVTLSEFVQRNEKKLIELEINARHQASAGWGDVDKCTYDEGYIEQPVYSCVTCAQKLGKRFGFCFGCSMVCHLEHEVVELFDKRHFRCDCPVECDETHCQLHEPVLDANTENQYNHNFEGLYCWCRKTYDHDSNDVMIQCVACQDWFHDTCIQKNYKTEVPASKKNDFICLDCTAKCTFLAHYADSEQINRPQSDVNNKNHVTESASSSRPDSFVKIEDVQSDGSVAAPYFEKIQTALDSAPSEQMVSPTKDSEESASKGAPQPDSTKCLIENKVLPSTPLLNVFFVRGWRALLCRCASCKVMYEQLGVHFLIDDPEPEDEDDDASDDEAGDDTAAEQSNTTVTVPTAQVSSLLPDMNQLMTAVKRKLSHVQQIEMAETVTGFTAALKEFVKPFAESGQVVTQEDITRFMEQVATGRDTKRRRL